jgi:hypothetical protein
VLRGVPKINKPLVKKEQVTSLSFYNDHYAQLKIQLATKLSAFPNAIPESEPMNETEMLLQKLLCKSVDESQVASEEDRDPSTL